MSGMTRGEIAEVTGVPSETVRYYERRGLIPSPPRTSGGYRIYGGDDVERLRFIKRAQNLGFTLSEIDELLALKKDPKVGSREVRQKAEAKLSDVREKISDLQKMARTLEELTEACPGEGPSSACPILDSMRANSGAE